MPSFIKMSYCGIIKMGDADVNKAGCTTLASGSSRELVCLTTPGLSKDI